jgi:hypothetical protein
MAPHSREGTSQLPWVWFLTKEKHMKRSTCMECHRETRKAGRCWGHHWRHVGEIPKDQPIATREKCALYCVVPKCNRPAVSKSLCASHRMVQRKGGDLNCVIKPSRRAKHPGAMVLRITLLPFVVEALVRRGSRLDTGSMARAVLEHWAQTDGAQRQRSEETDTQAAAWRRSDWDNRSGA